jgi:hypothetical protein
MTGLDQGLTEITDVDTLSTTIGIAAIAQQANLQGL